MTDWQKEFAAFEAGWLAELKPEGLIEAEWARGFIHATWLKHRVVEAVRQAPPGDARVLERLNKLEAGYERRAVRYLKELQRAQKERQQQQQPGSRRTPAAAASKRPLPVQMKPSKLVH